MVEQVAAPNDRRVVVYASGAGGGWGVLLTHGPSQRELSGVENGATRDRMSLLAVVNAVECLTRPTSVLVLTDNEYVRAGVAARTQGAVADERDVDLWARLGTAVRSHRVQWVVVDAALATRAAALADAPATTPRHEPGSSGTLARRELPAEVVAALRPASALGPPSEDRASLPFRAGDPVPAPAATPAAGPPAVPPPSEKDETDDAEGADEFLDELRFWLDDEAAPSGTVDEWLRNTPLRVIEVGEESITFDDPKGRPIGPVAVPAGLAEQAEPGWQLRLTAARTGDTWYLRPTE